MFEISSSLTFGYENICIISFLNPKLHPQHVWFKGEIKVKIHIDKETLET